MNSVHYSSKKTDWETPRALFDALNKQFLFTIDVAATQENAQVPRFYDELEDGLKQNWEGERVWCNPPYGRNITGQWVQKLAEGGGSRCRWLTAGAHRYQVVSSIRFRESGYSFFKRASQIRRGPARCAIPQHGVHLV